MRIQFILSCQKGTIIPINYQSEISTWIFTALSKAGSELVAHVQDMGFNIATHGYKQFTFSPLAIFPYEMDQVRQEFKLLGNQVKIAVSLYLNANFEQQVVSLFRQSPLQLGMLEGKPAFFEVKHWQILPRPNFKEVLQFKAVSPISITNTEDIPVPNPYILPDSETYDISFFTHLIRRFKAAHQYKSLATLKLLDPSFPMQYKLIGQAKSRLIHLKHSDEGLTQLRGFVYELELNAPPEVMEYAYFCGFGEFPHLGFGFVDFREEDKKVGAPGHKPEYNAQRPQRPRIGH
ncbi:MAG: CRISPR-associated endoribonuclease [Bacteroidota bacterium]|jgi:CRISPR-associated endoribonuclease Cas6